MYLKNGDRVPGDFGSMASPDSMDVPSAVSVYRVTDVVMETPWCGLYRGKKVFQNFHFEKRQFIETDEEDCLDVLLKTVGYPKLDNISSVVYSRNHASFELNRVLGCPDTDQVPEPIDLIFIKNTRDGFEFKHTDEFVNREPVLVFENICGAPLTNWINGPQYSIRAAMRIVGEILTLSSHLHSNGMLLNLLHPGSIWVDDSNRSHFMGTENVISSAKADGAEKLFPPNRYPPLFTAAELLSGATAPSIRTDILSLGSIIWFLLTKSSPFGVGGISAADVPGQRRPDSGKIEALRKSLSSQPSQTRRDIESWLELSGTKFEKRWPDGFVNGLLACLDPDPESRPSSVNDLRQIWITTPPFPVRKAIGVPDSSGKLSICFSTSLGASSYTIREKISPARSNGSLDHQKPVFGEQGVLAPNSHHDGKESWTGTKNLLTLSMSDPGPGLKRGLSVFAVDTTDGAHAFSRPTVVSLVDRSVLNSCSKFAESHLLDETTSSNTQSEQLPEELVLLAQLSSAEQIAEQLSQSQHAAVRIWGLKLLADISVESSATATRQLWSSLKDKAAEVRKAAIGIVIKSSPLVDAALLIKITASIAGSDLDARILALEEIKQCGVSASVVETAEEQLELRRPQECKLCRKSFPRCDMRQHLVEKHDFIVVGSQVLPVEDGVIALANALFSSDRRAECRTAFEALGDRQNERDVELLANVLPSAFLRYWNQALGGISESQCTKVLIGITSQYANLRIPQKAFRVLMGNDDPRIRLLGRSLFLRNVATRLSTGSLQKADYLRAVKLLVPVGTPEESITVAGQLAEFGADKTVAQQCIDELSYELPKVCPDCGESFTRRSLPAHRLSVHDICAFRGNTYRAAELRRILLPLVASADSDVQAAIILPSLFTDQKAVVDYKALCTAVSDFIESMPLAIRQVALTGAASTLVANESASLMAETFGKMSSVSARSLGLLVFSHLRDHIPDHLVDTVSSIIGDEEIALLIRQAAAANFARLENRFPNKSRDALRRFSSSLQEQGVRRVKILESVRETAGRSTTIDQLCQEILDTAKIRCRRCDLVLSIAEMKVHAAEKHQRYFDGIGYRRPAEVVKTLLDQYCETQDSSLLDEGLKVAQIEDPVDGEIRFLSEALSRGIQNDSFRKRLIKLVSESEQSVCPNCFALQGPSEPREKGLFVSDRLLEFPGVSIKFEDVTLFGRSTKIHVEGVEPGALDQSFAYTRKGAMLFSGIFTVPGAILFAITATMAGNDRLLWAGFSLCLVLFFVIPLCLKRNLSTLSDLAWTIALPELFKNDSDRVWAFANALCLTSEKNREFARHSITIQNLCYTAMDVVSLGSSQANFAEPAIGTLYRLRFQLERRIRLADSEWKNTVSRLFDAFLSGSISAKSLDTALSGLTENSDSQADVESIVRWLFLMALTRAKGNVNDLRYLAGISSRVRSLLQEIEGDQVKEFLALLLIATTTFESQKVTAAYQLTWNSIPEAVRRTGLFCSVDQSVFATAKGLLIRGKLYPHDPVISVEEQKEFVFTGWTHSRMDGGPDQRFKHNPRKGYHKTVGYKVAMNGEQFEVKSDPQELINNIRIVASFRRNFFLPKCFAMETSSSSRIQSVCYATPPSVCSRCTSPLQLVPGDFAIRAVRT